MASIGEGLPQDIDFTDKDRALQQMWGYLLAQQEQINYVLSHLDTTNLTETGLSDITDPVYAEIADTNGNVTTAQLTAEGAVIDASNAAGDAATAQITAEGAQVAATSAQTTADGAESHAAAVELTANGLTIDVSTAQSAANAAQSDADNAQDDADTAYSKALSVEVTVDGITVTDSSGTTTIDGSQIVSGTITGTTLHGSTIGGYTDVAVGSSDIKFYYAYDLAGHLGGTTDRLFLTSESDLQLSGDGIIINANDGNLNLNSSNGDVYVNGTSITKAVFS